MPLLLLGECHQRELESRLGLAVQALHLSSIEISLTIIVFILNNTSYLLIEQKTRLKYANSKQIKIGIFSKSFCLFYNLEARMINQTYNKTSIFLRITEYIFFKIEGVLQLHRVENNSFMVNL